MQHTTTLQPPLTPPFPPPNHASAIYLLNVPAKTWEFDGNFSLVLPSDGRTLQTVHQVATTGTRLAISYSWVNPNGASNGTTVHVYTRGDIALCAANPVACSTASEAQVDTAWLRTAVLDVGYAQAGGTGLSVSVHSNMLVVGRPWDNAVTLYRLSDDGSNNQWVPVYSLGPTDPGEEANQTTAADMFGAAVSLGERWLVVGAPGAGPFTWLKPRDVALGSTGSGATWVFPSPLTPGPLRDAAHNASAQPSDHQPLQTRFCRVAFQFAGGEYGYSITQSSLRDDTLVLGGAPGSPHVLVTRVSAKGEGVCEKTDRIAGFSYESSDLRLGHALSFDNELMFFGDPVALNTPGGSPARPGRLYAKAFCFPNRYIDITYRYTNAPAVRECFDCPAGKYSAGEGNTIFKSSCRACDGTKPEHAHYEEGLGCEWICDDTYYGDDCLECSQHKGPAHPDLPAHAHWVDGELTCEWDCNEGYLLAGDQCNPPPPPDPVQGAMMHNVTGSTAIITFFAPASVSYAAIVSLRATVCAAPGSSTCTPVLQVEVPASDSYTPVPAHADALRALFPAVPAGFPVTNLCCTA